jgi:hypothetical protein
VHGEVIHHHYLAGTQGRPQYLPDVEREGLGIG